MPPRALVLLGAGDLYQLFDDRIGGLEVFAKLRGAALHGVHAEHLQSGFDRGRLNDRNGFLLQPLHDRLGRAGRRQQGEPG